MSSIGSTRGSRAHCGFDHHPRAELGRPSGSVLPSSSAISDSGQLLGGSRRQSRSAQSDIEDDLEPRPLLGMQGRGARTLPVDESRGSFETAGTGIRPSQCTRSTRRARRAERPNRHRGDGVGLDLVRCTSARVLVRLIGFMSENSSAALSPRPRAAKACTDHVAAWLYWPPFSRIPGG